MARKRSASPTPLPATESSPSPVRPAVTADRFRRLVRLLRLLGDAPAPRSALLGPLGLDVRGFYRDLEFLRGAGIEVTLADGRYTLAATLDAALARLPFPDPQLTLGEMRRLAAGRSSLHARLREAVERLAE